MYKALTANLRYLHQEVEDAHYEDNNPSSGVFADYESQRYTDTDGGATPIQNSIKVLLEWGTFSKKGESKQIYNPDFQIMNERRGAAQEHRFNERVSQNSREDYEDVDERREGNEEEFEGEEGRLENADNDPDNLRKENKIAVRESRLKFEDIPEELEDASPRMGDSSDRNSETKERYSHPDKEHHQNKEEYSQRMIRFLEGSQSPGKSKQRYDQRYEEGDEEFAQEYKEIDHNSKTLKRAVEYGDDVYGSTKKDFTEEFQFTSQDENGPENADNIEMDSRKPSNAVKERRGDTRNENKESENDDDDQVVIQQSPRLNKEQQNSQGENDSQSTVPTYKNATTDSREPLKQSLRKSAQKFVRAENINQDFGRKYQSENVNEERKSQNLENDFQSSRRHRSEDDTPIYDSAEISAINPRGKLTGAYGEFTEMRQNPDRKNTKQLEENDQVIIEENEKLFNNQKQMNSKEYPRLRESLGNEVNKQKDSKYNEGVAEINESIAEKNKTKLEEEVNQRLKDEVLIASPRLDFNNPEDHHQVNESDQAKLKSEENISKVTTDQPNNTANQVQQISQAENTIAAKEIQCGRESLNSKATTENGEFARGENQMVSNDIQHFIDSPRLPNNTENHSANKNPIHTKQSLTKSRDQGADINQPHNTKPVDRLRGLYQSLEEDRYRSQKQREGKDSEIVKNGSVKHSADFGDTMTKMTRMHSNETGNRAREKVLHQKDSSHQKKLSEGNVRKLLELNLSPIKPGTGRSIEKFESGDKKITPRIESERKITPRTESDKKTTPRTSSSNLQETLSRIKEGKVFKEDLEAELSINNMKDGTQMERKELISKKGSVNAKQDDQGQRMKMPPLIQDEDFILKNSPPKKYSAHKSSLHEESKASNAFESTRDSGNLAKLQQKNQPAVEEKNENTQSVTETKESEESERKMSGFALWPAVIIEEEDSKIKPRESANTVITRSGNIQIPKLALASITKPEIPKSDRSFDATESLISQSNPEDSSCIDDSSALMEESREIIPEVQSKIVTIANSDNYYARKISYTIDLELTLFQF